MSLSSCQSAKDSRVRLVLLLLLLLTRHPVVVVATKRTIGASVGDEEVARRSVGVLGDTVVMKREPRATSWDQYYD